MTISPELFSKIRRLQLKMDVIATDLLAGLYLSAFKGKGMEFEEVREYQVGDDIRSIDWNVTARMNHPYIKVFKEERELTVMLIVDISSSTLFGSQGQLKKTLITEIAAALAFSAIKNQDKIGLILFSEGIDLHLSPKKGTKHVLRIIRELLVSVNRGKKTDLNQALAYFGKVQKSRAICFIISDFLCGDFSKELAPLAKKHEMIAVCISDPLEKQFPAVGLIDITDLETGETFMADTSINSFQEEYQKTALQNIKQHEKRIKEFGANWIAIQSTESYLEAIRKFFKSKKLRRK